LGDFQYFGPFFGYAEGLLDFLGALMVFAVGFMTGLGICFGQPYVLLTDKGIVYLMHPRMTSAPSLLAF
jgi:hypothetical protein